MRKDSSKTFNGMFTNLAAILSQPKTKAALTPLPTHTSLGSIAATILLCLMFVPLASFGQTDANDQISEAEYLGAPSPVSTLVMDWGTISPGTDVDMFSVDLTSGLTYALDFDRRNGSAVDSYLRVFNSSGSQLASNDDGVAPGESGTTESYLEFTPSSSGRVYIGISSFPNSGYSPTTGNGDATGTTTGDYTLRISVNTPTLSFGGAVTDSATGSGISGATVQWGSNSATTDSAGRYIFNFVPCGSQTLTVSKSGYATSSETFNPPCLSSSVKNVALALNDANDQISEAEYLGAPSASAAILMDYGAISPGTDVDMFSVDLVAGSTYAFDFDRRNGSSVDSYLRIFTGSGTQLTANDDGAAPGEGNTTESYVEYTPTSSGRVYVGISSFPNSAYNAATGSGDANGTSTGDYSLRISVNFPTLSFAGRVTDSTSGTGITGASVQWGANTTTTDSSGNYGFNLIPCGNQTLTVSKSGYVTATETFNPPCLSSSSKNVSLTPDDPNDQIAEAEQLGTPTAATPIVMDWGMINPSSDVDMFGVDLTAGLKYGMDFDRRNGSAVDSYLRVFSSSGSQLASNDDGAAPGESGTTESYLEFTPTTTARYFIGVSAFPNSGYSAINGTGDANGTTTGDYSLRISTPGMPDIRITPLSLSFDSSASSSAATASSPNLAVADATATRDELKLKNRRFVPTVETSTRRLLNKGYLLVQFTNSFNAELLSGLENAGSRIVNYVSDSTVVANVPAGLDLLSVGGVRWAGELSAADKISRSVKRNPAAQSVMLKTFPGADPTVARQTLAQLGCELITNKFLPVETIVVRANFPTIERIAALNDVAWIFPASGAVTSGQLVHECPGRLTSVGPVADFVTVGNGWDGSGQGAASLSFFFENGTDDIAGDAEQPEVERGLREWSKHAAITWDRANVVGLANSVDVSWQAAADHGDGSPFGVNTLAHAFYPPPINANPRAGDIHFNDAFNFSVGSGYDVFSLSMHEAGHSLGLDHSDDTDAVMYPIYQFATGLHADDIQGIQSIYAPANNTSASFAIYNDGSGTLTVNGIAPDRSVPGLTITPTGSFTIDAGQSRVVTVQVDYSQFPLGQTTCRLLVTSSDSDESPYPGGVTVTVNRVSPPLNIPPAFTSAARTNAVAGRPYLYNITATDSDSPTISFSATKPAWLALQDKGDGKATLSGIPPTAGEYIVSLSANDGQATVTQNFTIGAIDGRVSLVKQGFGWELVFQTAVGRRYRVESCSSLANPAWTQFGSDFTAVASIARLPISPQSPAQYFRIVHLD